MKILSLLKSISKTSSGILLAQILSLIFIPILSRVYSPEEFGEFGFYLATTVILSGVASWRLYNAISTPRSLLTVHALVKTSTLATLVTISALSPLIFYLFHATGYSNLLALISIVSATAVSFANVATQYLIRFARFKTYTFVIFLLIGLVPLLQFAMKDVHTNGLVIGSGLSQMLAGMISLIVIRKSLCFKSGHLRLRSCLRRYKSFPLYALPIYFLSMLKLRLVYYCFSGPKFDDFLGFYNQSDRLLLAPSNLFGITLRPLITNVLLKPENSHSKVLASLLKAQWYLLLPFTAFLFFYARDVLVFILGSQWAEAAEIFRIMLIPAFLIMTTISLDRFYDFWRAHQRTLPLEVITGVLLVIALLLVGRTYNEPLLALKLFAGILSLHYLIWILIIYRITGGSLKEIFEIFFKALMVLALSALMIYSFPSILVALGLITFTTCSIGVYFLKRI